MFSTLRAKIFAGFAAIIAINVVVAMWSFYRFANTGSLVNDLLASNADLAAEVLGLVDMTEQQSLLLQQFANANSTDRPALVTKISNQLKDVKISVSGIVDKTDTTRLRSFGAQLRSGYELYSSMANKMINNTADKRLDIDPLLDLLNEQKHNSIILLGRIRDQILSARTDLGDSVRQTLYVVALVSLLGMILGIIGGGIYARWAIQPITRLTQAVKNLSGGQLGERVLITTSDELGDLTYEFNQMLDRLRRYEAMNIEQLLLEKQKVDAIVQSVATPILVADAQMHALLVNRAAADLFRLDVRRKYEGVEIHTILDDTAVLSSLESAFSASEHPGSSPIINDIYTVQEEGKERFYAVQALPLKTTSSVNGVVAVFSDITQFKELDRLKSEFLAKVSHEFRTPLSSILMSLDILREGILGTLNEKQHELIDASKEDCKRLSKLIADLLELSRRESATRQRKPAIVRLNALITDIIESFRQKATSNGLQLIEQHSTAIDRECYIDSEDVRWILNNLITNAIRHTDSGGTIHIDSSIDSNTLVLSVTDTGHGIPRESLGRIFEKFYQVESSAVTTPGSVGLGLAIVKDIVESYGGTIGVTSEVGAGSTFTVRIPMSAISTTDV